VSKVLKLQASKFNPLVTKFPLTTLGRGKNWGGHDIGGEVRERRAEGERGYMLKVKQSIVC